MKAVILAGGSGTRLWPLSRQHKPKQFHSLVGPKTLFQETIDRLDFLPKKDIFISTNQEYLPFVQAQAPDIPKANIIIEPALRDTAACIGYAAIYIGKKYPNEVMSVIYSDHLIQKKAEFIKKLKVAENLARQKNTLNIIEVKAKYPNTHLGYVKIGKMLTAKNGVEIYEFKQFIEKPNLKTATKFLTSFKYLWNTGYYIWKIDTILKQYKKHAPKTYQILKELQKTIGTPQHAKALAAKYPILEKISIDYAIMEKVDPKIVRIIPADLGWNDIGTFSSLHEELTATSKHNLTKGPSLNIDSTGCLIYNYTPQLITTIGLKNLHIIATKDAILICPKDKNQEVKKIVEELKKRKNNNLV